jgi:hypothetical protein
VYRELGELYLLEGRDCARGHLLIGQSAAFEGDLAGALASFKTGLSSAPSADLAYGVGWCLLRQASPDSVFKRTPQQIEEAVAAFERGLSLDPQHLPSLNSLGHCHYWLAVLAHATEPLWESCITPEATTRRQPGTGDWHLNWVGRSRTRRLVS